MKLFWIGILVAPPIWYVVLKALWFIFIKQRNAIRDWYMGLPIVQWPAMLLVVLGTKAIKVKNCKVMKYDGRVWYSPTVKGFETKGE